MSGTPEPLRRGDILVDARGVTFVVDPYPDRPEYYLHHAFGGGLRPLAYYRPNMATLPLRRLGRRSDGMTHPDNTEFTELPERLPH